MFIKEIVERECLKVAIPLTEPTGKARVKKRNKLSDYGETIATRKVNLSSDYYIEWQIGYDALLKDEKKIKLTTLKDVTFKGSAGVDKALYELSEYIKYFYDWGIVNKEQLSEIINYLKELKENDFIDNNPSLQIKRSDPIENELNGFKFEQTITEYPLLIYKYEGSDIVAEIVIKEKQRAVGSQPMLYLCFPITMLVSDGELLIGRTAKFKETANFIVDRSNIFVFLETLKLFGILTKAHNTDVVNIIKTIIKE